jgi:glucose/arabinose dehydrogenase
MRSVRVILPCVLTAAGLAAWNTPISNVSPREVHSTARRDSALDGRLRVPPGFKVTYYANGLSGVRFMVVGPDRMLYVSQPRSGRIVRLPDRNGDGFADTTEIVVAGLNQPHGMAFHKNALYVANTDGVVRALVRRTRIRESLRGGNRPHLAHDRVRRRQRDVRVGGVVVQHLRGEESRTRHRAALQ